MAVGGDVGQVNVFEDAVRSATRAQSVPTGDVQSPPRHAPASSSLRPTSTNPSPEATPAVTSSYAPSNAPPWNGASASSWRQVVCGAIYCGGFGSGATDCGIEVGVRAAAWQAASRTADATAIADRRVFRGALTSRSCAADWTGRVQVISALFCGCVRQVASGAVPAGMSSIASTGQPRIAARIRASRSTVTASTR